MTTQPELLAVGLAAVEVFGDRAQWLEARRQGIGASEGSVIGALLEKRLGRLIARRTEYREDTGCWVWTGARKNYGYGVLSVAGRYWRVHRLVAMIVLGLTEESGLAALHRCDNPPCVNPDHLFLGTRADNNRDRDEKGRGRCVSGPLHPNAKLTREIAAAIRHRVVVGGEHQRAVASEFRVAQSTVGRIARRVAWRDA